MNLAHIPTPAFHLGNLPACRLSASPHAPRRTPILLSPTILHTRSNTNTTIPTAKQKRVDHFTG